MPPDGDMAAYLNSLDKLFAYDFERIAPGHGDVMERGKKVLDGAARASAGARGQGAAQPASRWPPPSLDALRRWSTTMCRPTGTHGRA